MARSIPKIGSRKTGRIGSRKHPGKIPKGHIFIQSSFNNTIVTVTDVRGRVISWSSAGSCGFKGKRRGTPAQGDLTPWSWSLLGGPCTFVAVYGLFELIGFMLRQFGFLDFMLRRQFQFLRLQYGPSYAIAFDLFLILAVFVTGIIFSPILNNILISNYREIRKRILLFLQKILLIFLDRVDEIAVSYLKYSLKYRRIININLNQKKKKRIVPTFKIRQARTSYGRLACLIIITDKARDLYFTPQGQKDFLLDTPEWLEKMDYRGRIHYDLTPPPQHNERFNLILTQLNDQFNKYLNWSTIIIKRIIKKGRGWVLILNNWVVDLALWIEKKEIKRRIRKHFEQLQHFIQLLFQSIFNFFKKLK